MGTVQTRYRQPTLGQLKEHVGFLASRSLTLPAAQPDEPQALFDDFHEWDLKNITGEMSVYY